MENIRVFSVKVRLPDPEEDGVGFVRVRMPDCFNFAYAYEEQRLPKDLTEHHRKMQIRRGVETLLHYLRKELIAEIEAQGLKVF